MQNLALDDEYYLKNITQIMQEDPNLFRRISDYISEKAMIKRVKRDRESGISWTYTDKEYPDDTVLEQPDGKRFLVSYNENHKQTIIKEIPLYVD